MNDQQKKMAAGAGFAVVAAAFLFFELHDSSAPPPAPAPPVITTASTSAPANMSGGAGAEGAGTARRLGMTAAELDPALRFGAMPATESLAYSGTGRNIFSAAAAAPVDIPRPVTGPRPGPVSLPQVVQTGPPPPPPIDLKFFGTATTVAKGRQAFLLKGEDVFLASAGDIVQRRYKVVSIAASSVVVQDLADNHQQTLPLLTN